MASAENCAKFAADPSVNPATKRSIKVGGPTWKKWDKDCEKLKPKNEPAPKQNKKQAKLNETASYYVVPGSLPRTIEASETWLHDNESKNIRLQQGDVVNTDGDRYGEAMIVVVDEGSRRRFVENPDYSGSGYLSIPPEATRSLDDAEKYYKSIQAELDNHLQGITIGQNDKKYLKIFKTPTSKLAQEAVVVYFFNEGEKFLSISYKGKSANFPLTVKQKTIEDEFAEMLAPIKTVVAKFYASVYFREITSTGSNSSDNKNLQTQVDADFIKSIPLPEGSKISKISGNMVTITCPSDKIWDVKDALTSGVVTVTK